jgi:chaperonin GroEL
MYRKTKSMPKIFISDRKVIKNKTLETMKKVSDVVGGTLGPGGKTCLLENSLPDMPNKITKDGVSVFSELASLDPIEHVIIETARDVAQRVSESVGDGTTTATILSYQLIESIFKFSDNNPKYSPQKITRRLKKVTNKILVPYIQSRAIGINDSNIELLRKVAVTSVNGDQELADAVIQCFELIGFGDSSHVTIREQPGSQGFHVSRIDGLPLPTGLDDLGKFSNVYVNDKGGLRCYLEKPLFLLFDGVINDLIQVDDIFAKIGTKYANGDMDFKNLVIMANGFSENIMNTLAFNFANPQTINILPVKVPFVQFTNSQHQLLMDMAAFTNSKIFGLNNPLSNAEVADLGRGMDYYEAYRFRSTIVGDPPESINIEVRASELKKMMENCASKAEKIWIEERLAKLTCGIAKLTISAGSSADTKELRDRAEDAVLATRSTIKYGCLPGGARIAIDMAMKLASELEEGDPAREVLIDALLSLPNTLLDNAGYSEEEKGNIITKLIENQELVYDINQDEFGDPVKLGLFDAAKSVEDSLCNAVSIASVLGTLGGLVVSPRDPIWERQEAREDANFQRTLDNAGNIRNEANERP